MLMGMYTPPLKATFVKDNEKALVAFSSNDVSKAFGKLDAPHLVLVAIPSCALVVSR